MLQALLTLILIVPLRLKAEFLEETQSNYQRLRSCLRDNPNFKHPETAQIWQFPEDAHRHYETLLGITAKYRYESSSTMKFLQSFIQLEPTHTIR